MSPATQLYQDLADAYAKRGEFRQRDIFLVLAADAALSQGERDQAERLRQKLLQGNPYHLLKPYPDLTEALKAGDVVDYVTDLRRQFPPDRAGLLLQGLQSPSATVAATLDGSSPPGAGPTSATLPGPTPGRAAGTAPKPSRRRAAPSPYDDRSTSVMPGRAEEPKFTWAPGTLFFVVLALALTWVWFTLVVPALD